MRTLLLIVTCYVAYTTPESLRRRFEYKYSFKGPHLVQPDGTVPFWDHGGDAIPTDTFLRVTPSLRSKQGHIWSKNTLPFEHWEVEIAFRVSGRGKIGADGLAFWFTEERGKTGVVGSNVFGSNDRWKGLGLFFDSFDNDGKQNNPYIMAMVNDGTKTFEHQNDGSMQQLGGCMRDYRNKLYPVRAKIQYYRNILTVFVSNGLTQDNPDFELCIREENVYLPSIGYFGISAATGGLADDHDVYSVITHSLHPALEKDQTADKVSEDQRKKFEQEFEDYYEKLKKEKEDYEKTRPKEHFEEDVDEFESIDDRRMKQVLASQENIHTVLRQLNDRIQVISTKQDAFLQQLSAVQPAGTAPSGGPIGTMERREVDNLLNSQRELIATINHMRSTIEDVQGRVIRVEDTSRSQPPAGGGHAPSGGSDFFSERLTLHEVRDNVNSIRADVTQLLVRSKDVSQCPPAPSCLTIGYFLFFAVAQVAIFIAYLAYRSHAERSAKKFY